MIDVSLTIYAMSDEMAIKYAETTHLALEETQEHLSDGVVQYACCEINVEHVKDAICCATLDMLYLVSLF